jgi:hypothetical protein
MPQEIKWHQGTEKPPEVSGAFLFLNPFLLLPGLAHKIDYENSLDLFKLEIPGR